MQYIERVYLEKDFFTSKYHREPLFITMGEDSYELITRNLHLPFGIELKDMETFLGMKLNVVKMNRRPYLITIGHVVHTEEFYLD